MDISAKISPGESDLPPQNQSMLNGIIFSILSV